METHIYIEDKHGNKHYKHIRYSTYAELQKKIHEIEIELNHAPLISDALDEWEAEHNQQIELNTIDGYKAPIKQIREHFGDKHMDEIKPIDVTRFLNKLYDDYDYAKQTLKLRLIVLNLLFNWAITVKDYVDYNPCSAVKVPAKAKQTKRPLPPEKDVKIIKAEGDGSLFDLYAKMLIWTGGRRCEILALEASDLCRDEGYIKIDKTLVWDKNKPIIKPRPKTEAGNRICPLLPQLGDMIPPNTKGFIFSLDGGKTPLSRSQFIKGWKKYRDSLGIDMTAHQFRHQFATELFDNEVPAKAAAAILGHANTATTENVYQHIDEERQKKNVLKLVHKIG